MKKLLLISLLACSAQYLSAMNQDIQKYLPKDSTNQQGQCVDFVYPYVVANQERELVLATDGSLYWIEDINYEEERKSAVSANEWTFNGIIELKPTLLLVLDFNQYHRVREVRINQKEGVALVNTTQNEVPDQYKDWEILYIDDLRFTLILGEERLQARTYHNGLDTNSTPLSAEEIAVEKSEAIRSKESFDRKIAKIASVRNKVVDSWGSEKNF